MSTTYYENQTTPEESNTEEGAFAPADVERQHSADVYEDMELEDSQLIGNSCSVTVRVDDWNDDDWLIIQTTDTGYTPNKTVGNVLTVPADIGTTVTFKSGGTGNVLLTGRVELSDDDARR